MAKKTWKTGEGNREVNLHGGPCDGDVAWVRSDAVEVFIVVPGRSSSDPRRALTRVVKYAGTDNDWRYQP